MLNSDDLLDTIRADMGGKSIAVYARMINVCEEQLRSFIRGKRPPEPKLLSRLGFERVIQYREIPDSEEVARRRCRLDGLDPDYVGTEKDYPNWVLYTDREKKKIHDFLDEIELTKLLDQ